MSLRRLTTAALLVASVLLVSGLALGLSDARESQASDASGPRSGPVLQFELPEDHDRRRPDGLPLLTGFEVGYFDAAGKTRLWSFWVALRDLRIVSPGVGEIQLRRQRVPAEDQITVRLRTQSAGNFSEWSDPSPPMTAGSIPEDVPVRARENRAERSLGLDPADIERYPSLKRLLDEVKPGTMSLDEALTGFRNARGLATALFLSRSLDVPFAELHRRVLAGGEGSLIEIVAGLRPGIDARREVRRANGDAGVLLRD